MAWFTTGDVDLAITTATRQKLAPSTAAFDAAEQRARVRVKAAWLHGGYASSDTSPTALQKDVALWLWVKDRMAGVGLSMPEQVSDAVSILQGVWSGQYPDPDADPNTRDGIGGSKWSSTSETSTSGRPARFSRSELKTW